MARLRGDGTLVWLHSDKQLPNIGWLGPGLPLLSSHDGQLLAFAFHVVTSLNPDSGDILWRTQINYEQGTWNPSFASATVDSNGDIWAVGSFDGTIEAGGFSVTPTIDVPNGQDAFLARFSPTGTVIGLESISERFNYGLNSVAAYSSGGVLVGKSFDGKTAYERRNNDATVAQKWESPNQLYHLEQGTENAIYASGFKPYEGGIGMFLEEQDGQGASRWQRTLPLADPLSIGFGELRPLPECRASVLLAGSYVSEGTDFGLGKIHCPKGFKVCAVLAISRP